MRVIFCYSSNPHPKALEAIAKFAPDAELVKTPGLFGYNEAIASRWGKDDLIVIEGDKEVTAEVIPSFASCDEPWCTYAYYNYPEPYQAYCSVGLGCAKFSVELQRHPDYGLRPVQWRWLLALSGHSYFFFHPEQVHFILASRSRRGKASPLLPARLG